MTRITNRQFICRNCAGTERQIVIDLGDMPHANALQTPDSPAPPVFPLRAVRCTACHLVQLDYDVDPNILFENYVYLSSFSTAWLEHAKNFSETAIGRLNINADSLVIEVASNDGYLLRYFRDQNIPVLGIEPSSAAAERARNLHIETIEDFLTESIADDLISQGKTADLIIANNVMAHVSDLDGFLRGIAHLLKSEGVLTIEFPHILKLLENGLFDTIYHEHYSYFSLMSAQDALRRRGLVVFDVEKLNTHGGSLRLWCARAGSDRANKITGAVDNLLESEFAARIDTGTPYADLANYAETCRQNLLDFLQIAQDKEQVVAGYGAPAKAATILNYCNITSEKIAFTVDRNPIKHGKLIPGCKIPIKPVKEIESKKPDLLCIFPWNIKEEIIEQMSGIKFWNGKFFTILPNLEIINR